MRRTFDDEETGGDSPLLFTDFVLLPVLDSDTKGVPVQGRSAIYLLFAHLKAIGLGFAPAWYDGYLSIPAVSIRASYPR